MNFFENPNLPDRPAKGMIVDRRADTETLDSLKVLGIEPILSYKSRNLCPAVCSHPDMTILHMGENKFICAPDAWEYYNNLLPDARMIRGEIELSPEYPRDITYNIAVVGGYAFLNLKTSQARINTGRRTINVRQGYAKCGTCVVGEKAIITADTGICAAARENGLDALLIEPGHIELPGMNYGFIGGASGLIAPHSLAVNGELDTHPNGGEIVNFCRKHDVEIVELKHGSIYDIGSLLPIF